MIVNTLAISHAIVTRPAHQGKFLCEGIGALGLQPIHLPSLTIAALMPDENTLDQLHFLDQADLLIVTSANVAPFLAPFWPKEGIKGQLIAVGPSTKQALEAAGIAVDATPEHFTSEGILAMTACQTVAGQRVFILSGEGGRTLLLDSFIERGAHVQKIALYQRLCPPQLTEAQLSHLLPHQVLVIFTSFDSLSHWWQMFPETQRPWLLTQQTLVISERLQEQATALGFSTLPWLADNATDQAILACIKSHLPLEEAS